MFLLLKLKFGLKVTHCSSFAFHHVTVLVSVSVAVVIVFYLVAVLALVFVAVLGVCRVLTILVNTCRQRRHVCSV